MPVHERNARLGVWGREVTSSRANRAERERADIFGARRLALAVATEVETGILAGPAQRDRNPVATPRSHEAGRRERARKHR